MSYFQIIHGLVLTIDCWNCDHERFFLLRLCENNLIGNLIFRLGLLAMSVDFFYIHDYFIINFELF